MAQIAHTSTRPTEELAVYVTTASGSFALKINNRLNLKNNLQRMQLAASSYEDSFKNYITKGQNLEDQVVGLLNFIKKEFGDMDLGTDVYQKNINGNWEKLGLSSNAKTVTRKEC